MSRERHIQLFCHNMGDRGTASGGNAYTTDTHCNALSQNIDNFSGF